ncbi:MAG: hypothetical protein BWK76_19830 [Desulfobulbaceae bacterium A2]|nr:MAG: hypothetical protein BWK76_19830 [Desulfobulbaceae bacterium A2]
MNHKKLHCVKSIRLDAQSKRTTRKHLNIDAMIKLLRKDFRRIPDHRADNSTISLDDALMSAYFMPPPEAQQGFLGDASCQIGSSCYKVR